MRAGMVAAASDYKWSSYGANALGQPNDLLKAHSCYLALGENGEARQCAYRELFQSQVDDESLKAIRESANSGLALGGERFKDQVEALLARSVRAGNPGRPKKNRAVAVMHSEHNLDLGVDQ